MPLFTFLLSLSELISPIHSLVSTSLSTSLTHEAQLILISLIHSPVSQARQRRRPIKLDSSSSTTSSKLPHSSLPINLRPTLPSTSDPRHRLPQTHAASCKPLLPPISLFSLLWLRLFFYFLFFIWVWWLWWWWLILDMVVVVDDFGFGSGFCGFWLWVLWFMVVVMVVAVAVGCGCGCHGWLSWLVVCGDWWRWGCDYGCGFVFFVFFYVVLWLPK